jgi:hypothetical protein
VQEDGAATLRADVLTALPGWFGIPDSEMDDVESAHTHPAVVPTADGLDFGVLTLRMHTPDAAESVVMGVPSERHRCGIGRAMREAAAA